MALVGNPMPRLYTPEARPLTRATSRGYEVIEFAREVVGEPLLPWQETAAIRALELNPDGTYRYRVVVILVARRSGKSHLLKILNLWRMYCDGVRLVVGAAQDLTLASEVWQAAVNTAKAAPELADEVANVRYANGEKCLTLVNGARYIIKAATRGAGRGLGVGQLFLDEVREWRSWDPWNALSPTTMAERNGMIWCLSNAGDDQSVVLNRLRESALAGTDDTICLLEWSAPEGCELDDEDAWVAANPGLGHVTNEQALRTALATMTAAAFRTEHLCQQVSQLDEAINLAAWQDCADPAATMDALRSRVCLGVDVAPDGQHVTAVAAARAGAGVRVEVVAAWSSTTEARAGLPDILAKVKPRRVAWYPSGPAAALGPLLRQPDAIEITGTKVAEACQSFADLVVARQLAHNGDPLLSSQVTSAARTPAGDGGWRFARKGGVGHVDAVYAAAAAVHAALAEPAPVKPRLIVAA